MRNPAIDRYHKLGQPIDEAKIGTEAKNNFRKLLLPQQLRTTEERDIDELYEAIRKGEIE